MMKLAPHFEASPFAPGGVQTGYAHRCSACGGAHVVHTMPSPGLRGLPNGLTGTPEAPSFRDPITAGSCAYTMTDGVMTMADGSVLDVPEWTAP